VSETPHRVRFGDLARGVLRGVPDIFTINKGLFDLVTLKADRKVSIGAVLEQQARRRPQAPALRFETRQWCYGEFNAWANRHAHAFAAAGVGGGDVIAILMENRPEVLAAVAGTVKLGAVAGMLNHQQRGDVLLHSLRLIRPRLLLLGAECAEAWAGIADQVAADGITVLWDGDAAAPAGTEPLAPRLAAASDSNPPSTGEVVARQPCFYIFTSGTTGLPKASVMTHYRWLRGRVGLGQLAMRLKADDVFYCALPLYHNNALTVSWGAALGAGATFALGRKFSASRFWDEVRQHQATAFCYIGELCRYLLNQPVSPRDRQHSVRAIVGNGLRPELWARFEARFGIEKIYEFYGASECNAAFINAFGLRGTAGFTPMTYAVVDWDAVAEAPARDGNGFLRRVAKGGVGLLLTEISERAPFDGYTDRKATEAKLLRDVFKSGDCWFNTGDLVRDQGYRHVQFVDRLGDTFRWKGENVATTEVEAALNAYAGVEQAVVYGVEVPHAEGRAGMAALTLSPAVAEGFDGAALAAHLQAQLPAYAVPLFLRLRAQQETTGTFKYRKVELKAEGFDPECISEPLYVLADRGNGYQLLTPALYARIVAAELRL